MQSPLRWRRGPRETFQLGKDRGVYALFLAKGSALARIEVGAEGLLYIGSANGRSGLKGRCHFNASTANHSPRKSLAVVLMNELRLNPIRIRKPNAPDSWSLDKPSDQRLSEWMHFNLELAVTVCAAPAEVETRLVGRYAPPLNLNKCKQTTQHARITALRTEVMRSLRE